MGKLKGKVALDEVAKVVSFLASDESSYVTRGRTASSSKQFHIML
jgi:hypothetical protein